MSKAAPKIKPWSPAEVAAKARDSLPDFVIAAVNQLLAENYRNGRADLTVDTVARAIHRLDPAPGDYGISYRSYLNDKGWLDFEPAFRAVGWVVIFDKPGLDESYDSFWRFTRAR